jgi:DNA-binding MarR family transcriptional regulator
MFAMSDRTPPIPLDLSGHRELPPAEIAPLLERGAAEPEERALSALTALLMNRVLRLLRQGSQEDLHEEALMLNRALAIPAGVHLQKDRPEAFGVWKGLGELLSGAARSTSRAAVPSLLRSASGRGQEILELLAGESGPVPRTEIKRRLKLAESQLSHLLRDLEEADLVIRYRPEKTKEVLVELGPVGREVVSQSVLPSWLERLTQAVSEIAGGSPFDSQTLSRELAEAGAPSRLAAERLAEAVARLAPAAAHRARPEQTDPAEEDNIRRFIREVQRLPNSELEAIQTTEAGLHPGAGFSTSDAA